MSQESFFAKREDSFSSFHNLFEHLSRLQQLHGKLMLDAFGQRHAALLAPLNEGRLRAPSPGDCWEYLVDCGNAACCSGMHCASVATIPWPTSAPAIPCCSSFPTRC